MDAIVADRRVSSMPHPILQTLLESCKFKAHIYHKFVKAITLFWKEANVSFKENGLYLGGVKRFQPRMQAKREKNNVIKPNMLSLN